MAQQALIVFLLCAVLGAMLLMKEVGRIRQERLLMTKLRNSNFYGELYALVRYARRHDLDQVRVERGRIVFYGVCPFGKICEYSLARSGCRTLSGNRTRVLAEVLGEDIPVLKTHFYSLRRYRIVLPNGQKEYGYVYVLRPIYKTQLMYARRYAAPN